MWIFSFCCPWHLRQATGLTLCLRKYLPSFSTKGFRMWAGKSLLASLRNLWRKTLGISFGWRCMVCYHPLEPCWISCYPPLVFFATFSFSGGFTHLPCRACQSITLKKGCCRTVSTEPLDPSRFAGFFIKSFITIDMVASPLHHSGFFGPSYLVHCHHPCPLLCYSKMVDVLSWSQISWPQLPTSRRLGHKASSSLSLEPYKTAFHTVCWLCSDGTVLIWTIQNWQSHSVCPCPPARLPASGPDAKSRVDVETGRLEWFLQRKILPFSHWRPLPRAGVPWGHLHSYTPSQKDMALILETRVQSHDEGMTRCKHQGFLFSYNLTGVAGGDASFF